MWSKTLRGSETARDTPNGNVLEVSQLLLSLLSYHRRLRMISEALEMREEGGRVSHSWCMCVVSHGYGECGVGWDRGGG